MSFGDLYTAPPGSAVGGGAPGLPPVDLPKSEARPPLRVTVHPEASPDGAFGAALPEFKPQAVPQASKPEDVDGIFGATLPNHTPEAEAAAKHESHEDISGGEAFARSVGSGISFGAAPALEGLAAASGEPAPSTVTERASGKAAFRPIQGAINLFKEHDAGVEGPATEAYRQGRDAALTALEAGRGQHPLASLAGEVAGSVLAPLPGTSGLAQGASLGTRLARGAAMGGAGGALYGAGSAISKGEDLGQALGEIAGSAVTGAGIGSAFHGAIGPRVRTGTRGARAAQTAEDLGAPLPRGLASDNAAVNATTAKLRSVPFVGSRLSSAVDATQQAAGRRIEQIAAGPSGTPPNRALAGSALRPALQGVIDQNIRLIDQSYDALRRLINPNRYGATPNTRNALEGVIRARRGQRVANPEAGFADLQNLIRGGISFNGLQRARNALGRMIDFHEVNPHPGFDVADLRRIYAAMTADMEGIARQHAHGNPTNAVNALRSANHVADQIIERNRGVQRVLSVDADERRVGALLTAAQERTGNLRMLVQLRNSMAPDDFHHIAGTLLSELGHNGTNADFSLNRFINGWDRISDGAKNILFTPQHQRNIEDIVSMGRHIRGALRESNTSHTAGVLILFDLARDAILLGASAAAGTLSGASTVGAALATPGIIFSHWLASPATAASMSRWAQARRGLIGSPNSAARRAAFNIATRNLAHMIGVPAGAIAQRALAGPGAGDQKRAPLAAPAAR